MNWNLIKEKCPKALSLLMNETHWVMQGDELCYTHELDSFISPRDLYDFFDEQGIYIDTLHNYDYGDKIIWFCWIDYKEKRADFDISYSRTEAEEKAFEKAFEILENKLNNG